MKKLGTRSMKKKVFFILFFSVVLTAIVFTITLNVFITSYIGREASEAISQQIDLFETPYDSWEEDPEYDEDEIGLFTVNSFSVDKDFTFSIEDENIEEYFYYLSKDDRAIQDYFEENPYLYEDDNIFSAKIDDQRYKIGTANITWNDMFEGEITEQIIFYVNETPLYRIVYILNGLFLIILAVSIVGAIFAGLKAGKIIEHSQQKLKNFFANASHELKTPLMSIQGYAEGLKTGVITDQDMATDVIINQSDKMYALVEELLYLSKIESGEFVFKKNKIDINAFTEDSCSSVAGLASKNKIKINYNSSQNHVMVLGDESQLQKAFINIISNGLRYAETTISISITQNVHHVEIWIEDDGEGIAQQDLPYIFERFYTGHHGNTGIGLSLAKEIISQQKGTIKAMNGSKGAKFIITLPRCN